MSSDVKTVSNTPLIGSNYPTWKLPCRMPLIRDGLRRIVNGTDPEPPEEEAARQTKYLGKKHRALSTIVLTVDPSLFYLIGNNLEDHVVVWRKLENQFQKISCANKLVLPRKLHSLRLTVKRPVQEHIKAITELFNELAIVDDVIED